MAISLQQFFWITSPGTTEPVQGPWVFHLTPEMLASHPSPAPRADGAIVLTFAQAHKLAPFYAGTTSMDTLVSSAQRYRWDRPPDYEPWWMEHRRLSLSYQRGSMSSGWFTVHETLATVNW